MGEGGPLHGHQFAPVTSHPALEWPQPSTHHAPTCECHLSRVQAGNTICHVQAGNTICRVQAGSRATTRFVISDANHLRLRRPILRPSISTGRLLHRLCLPRRGARILLSVVPGMHDLLRTNTDKGLSSCRRLITDAFESAAAEAQQQLHVLSHRSTASLSHPHGQAWVYTTLRYTTLRCILRMWCISTIFHVTVSVWWAYVLAVYSG